MALVLDAGALVAIERRDRTLLTVLERALDRDVGLVTSAGVLAQVWRDGARQAALSRWLPAIRVLALDSAAAREIGGLLGRDKSSDVVDGHVVCLIRRADHVLTSDVPDMQRLLRTRGVSARVVRI